MLKILPWHCLRICFQILTKTSLPQNKSLYGNARRVYLSDLGLGFLLIPSIFDQEQWHLFEQRLAPLKGKAAPDIWMNLWLGDLLRFPKSEIH